MAIESMKQARLIIGLLAGIAVVAVSAMVLNPHDNVPNGRALPVSAGHDTVSPAANALVANSSTAVPPVKPLDNITAPVHTTTLLGSVVAETQASLSAPQPSRISGVLVREGDPVRRGQTLVRFDDISGRTQTRTAEAGMLAAQAQIDRARAGREAQRLKADADIDAARSGLQQAKAKLSQAVLGRDAAQDVDKADLVLAQQGERKAQISVDRTNKTAQDLETLSKVGGVSRSDLEGARTQAAVAQSDLTMAQAQLQRLLSGPKDPNGASAPGGTTYRAALAQKDTDAARAGIRQAQAGLATAKKAKVQIMAVANSDIAAALAGRDQAEAGVSGAAALGQTARLTSPIDGIATSVTARIGETAQPGSPLVTIVLPAGLRIEALVPARLLSQLRVGQKVRVILDTLPDHPFTASVNRIASAAEPDGRTFRVTFQPHNAPYALRLGQTARLVVNNPRY